MKTTTSARDQWTAILSTLAAALLVADCARAATTVFFNSSQTTNLVASGETSDTISSEGYLFTFTRDKLFTGGVGLTNPIGRTVRVPWPSGLEAQAVTAGPNPRGARFDIEREDGEPFAIQSFTAQLLANTAGAGAAFEIMPLLDGEDGRPDPFMYNATGYYGQHFTYSTPELTGFDAYKLTLYVDFAVMSLTVVDHTPILAIRRLEPPTFQISWPTNAVGYSLQSATNLPAQAWTTVTNDVTIDGDLFTVQVENTLARRFYRLRK